MTKLIGWAVPLNIKLPADHTYVTCQGNKAWPCWGRSTGGKQICSGTGSSVAADCISKPWSTAKLIYGVTGVCHQTANRILWPAGVTVRKARGYWASWLLYGTYGKGLAVWLATLAACGTKTGDIPECTAGGGGEYIRQILEENGPDGYAKRLQAYYEELSSESSLKALASTDLATGFLNILDGETQIMLEERIDNIDVDYVSKIIHDVRIEALETATMLDESFSLKSIGPEDVSEQMNTTVNQMLKVLTKGLGGDLYSNIMELEPGEEINIVDPAMMANDDDNPRA